MGTEFVKMLLSQAEEICHCIREARRIFGYRHYGRGCQRSEGDNVDGGLGNINNTELERKLSLTVIYFSRFSSS